MRSDEGKAGRWVRGSGLVGLGVISLVACGNSPIVRTAPGWQSDALHGKRVLFVPIAVSDELGDARTGIVLSDAARSIASAEACKNLAQEWTEGTLVCLTSAQAHSPPVLELERLFALDRPISAAVWQSVCNLAGTDHALLFRPESVTSSNSVERTKERGTPIPFAAPIPGTSSWVFGIVSTEGKHYKTSSSTELAYTVSASLIDNRRGKLLRVGVHSGSGSREVGRNLGYAEAPPAAPILEDIMTQLGEEVLTR